MADGRNIGEETYYRFLETNEEETAKAIKASWDPNSDFIKSMGLGKPTDDQFRQWAHQLIHERKMTLVNARDPSKKLDVTTGMLQQMIDKSPKARDTLLVKFKTDQIDNIVLDKDKVHKVASSLGHTAEERATPGIMDYIMGFMEWLFNGIKNGFTFRRDKEGSLLGGIKDTIAERVVSNFSSSVESDLAKNTPDVHQGVREYISAQAKKAAEKTAGIGGGEEPQRLADVRIGENVAPAAPSRPIELDVKDRAPTTEEVLAAMAKNYITEGGTNKTQTPQQLDESAKAFTRVALPVVEQNRALVEKRDFDTLSDKIAQAMMADKEMKAVIYQKAQEKLGDGANLLPDALIANYLKGDIKTQMTDPTAQRALVASVTGQKPEDVAVVAAAPEAERMGLTGHVAMGMAATTALGLPYPAIGAAGGAMNYAVQEGTALAAQGVKAIAPTAIQIIPSLLSGSLPFIGGGKANKGK